MELGNGVSLAILFLCSRNIGISARSYASSTRFCAFTFSALHRAEDIAVSIVYDARYGRYLCFATLRLTLLRTYFCHFLLVHFLESHLRLLVTLMLGSWIEVRQIGVGSALGLGGLLRARTNRQRHRRYLLLGLLRRGNGRRRSAVRVSTKAYNNSANV